MLNLNIGTLRHRVTIQQLVRTSDGMGGFEETWTDIKTVWAHIEPVFNVTQTKEKFTAEQMIPVMTHRVRIRFDPIMTPDKRLKWGNRVLEPRSVIPENGVEKYMLMFCDETLGGSDA